MELNQHQQRVVDKLQKQRGVIVYHGLGTGKTRTAIASAEKFGGAVVVVPASLKTNFENEIKSSGARGKYDIYSYEKFLLDQPSVRNRVLIIDEGHKAKNAKSRRAQALLNASKQARKVIVLTGTPIQNHPSELASLINIVDGEETLPSNESKFNKEFVHTEKGYNTFIDRIFGNTVTIGKSPKNLHKLKRAIRDKIDYHERAPDSKDFPSMSMETVSVSMTPEQYALYKGYEGKIPKNLKKHIAHGTIPNAEERAALNSFINSFRQISNTGDKFSPTTIEVPKIQEISKRIKQSSGPSLVYSNYLDSGVKPLSRELTKTKTPHGVYTGELSKDEKANLIDEYNKGKLKALLVSSAGGEGLNLKRTRQVHLMEPHWHKAKLEQVIGRAARYKSHEDLPAKDRHVDVYQYVSSRPPEGGNIFQRILGMKPKQKQSVEEYLTTLSSQKEELNNKFLNVLKN